MMARKLFALMSSHHPSSNTEHPCIIAREYSNKRHKRKHSTQEQAQIEKANNYKGEEMAVVVEEPSHPCPPASR